MKKDNSNENNKPMRKKENIIEKIFKVNGKFDFKELAKNIAIPLLGSIAVGFLTSSSGEFYSELIRPAFAPPGWVFPIIWPILYILMGIAAYRISMYNKQGTNTGNAYFTYLLQLAINFLWPIIFFNLRLYGIAFVIILILLIFIIITTVKFYKIDKVAGLLMIPYILWVSFASVLNFFIWLLNEM